MIAIVSEDTAGTRYISRFVEGETAAREFEVQRRDWRTGEWRITQRIQFTRPEAPAHA